MPITRQTEEYPEAEILDSLHPVVREWFVGKFGTFSPPQRFSILNIDRGINTLISSPTGSGKTLSAFLAIMNKLILLQQEGKLEQKVYCVYLSPLKALANDITKNLKEPLAEMNELAKKQGIKLDIKVGSRTGDTTPSQRASMLAKPPHILITTPESLAISLTTTKFREMLKTASYLIVDEIHALAESKRGVHLSISAERLADVIKEADPGNRLVRIGLSATVHPLEEVGKFLVGLDDPDTGKYRDCAIVDVQAIKRMDLKVLCPVKDIMRASHAETQSAMYDLLHDLIQGHKTTLVFTNTRAATERVVHQLKARYPRSYTGILDGDTAEGKVETEQELESEKNNKEDKRTDNDNKSDNRTEDEERKEKKPNEKDDENDNATRISISSTTKKTGGYIGAHHGSLSKAHRLNIENRLKRGELKAVVCSTSLELGIDIGSIDLVVLLGSPKSVARALQRIGRSGHQLHEEAKGRIIVLDRDDMVECSVLLKAAIEKKIDRVHIPLNALDVLAQQLFGMAIDKVWDAEELYRTVRKSHCYASLPRGEYEQVLDYLSGEYSSLEERSVYAKIWYDKATGRLGRRGKLARLIYLTNVGTIPDETSVKVKLGEEVIGTIDEDFLERLTPGDVFVLGGETYEFRFARGLTAQVKTSAGHPPTVPRWASEMLPLSYDLALEIQTFRKYMDELFRAKRSKQEIIKYMDSYLYADERTLSSIYEYFREQYKYVKIPHRNRLLIEHFKEGNKRHVIVHALYGRRVNDVLSRALGFALGKLHNRDVAITITDTGFSLRSTAILNVAKALELLKSDELERVMRLALDKSEVLNRRFRHCAARSLMILRTYKGESKSVGKQQMNSRLLLAAVKRISEDFPVLREARREVLEDLMDLPDAADVLRQIESGALRVDEVATTLPSPFAFNIVLKGYTDILKIEERKEFLKRMHELLLKEIDAPDATARKKAAEEIKKEKPSFSYEELWHETEERRLAERDEQLEALKRMAWNVEHVPTKAKRELVQLLEEGKIGEYTERGVRKYKDEILKSWPPELIVAVFDRLGIPYDKEAVLKDEERNRLRQQFRKAAQKADLDDEIVAAAEKLIDGKRVRTKAFWEFVDTLLSKAVPKYWGDEIVKFLQAKKDEKEDFIS